MWREESEQPFSLFPGDPAGALVFNRIEPDLRYSLDPLPFIPRFAQNGPDEGEMTIRCRWARFLSLSFADLNHPLPGDFTQAFTTQIWIKPT